MLNCQKHPPGYDGLRKTTFSAYLQTPFPECDLRKLLKQVKRFRQKIYNDIKDFQFHININIYIIYTVDQIYIGGYS